MTSNAEDRLQESDHSDYESCGEEVEGGDRDGDLTRPSEWTPGFQDARETPETQEDTGGGEASKGDEGGGASNKEEEKEVDRTGEEKGSPDYVDEDRLREEEEGLTEDERESRRVEAVDLKQQGNSLYKEGKPQDAVAKYTAGLNICPLSCSKERAVLYANRAQMKRVLDEKDKAIRNCSIAIEIDSEYLKAYLRRAELYQETEKLDEALEDFKRVIELDPSNQDARRALIILPQKIEERNEKMKEEMMQNLKKLGNMVLKPFGMSTDNFNMVQDPSTGGYNLSFSQNK